MRMLLVGAGAVGESILRILKQRDPEARWLEFVLVGDYHEDRAREVAAYLQEPGAPVRFAPVFVDAKDEQGLIALIRSHRIDFVMDAADPYVSNHIFDAAFAAGARYGNMGTWSVPKEHPAFGLGIENSYDQPMTRYNFDRHQAWQQAGLLACICMGIDPGVVNVFAKYAATQLLDTLREVHIKDGGNLTVPGASEDTPVFGFNVWTVLDEVMNPNVEYDASRGGLWVEDAFAGEEEFPMPEGIGNNRLVKVEHEETVTLPRYLKQYGLQRATFKIALDPALIHALKVIDALGLRSLKPVQVDGVQVIPRDVVAACAPQPKDIGAEMQGAMCVGAHCLGTRGGRERELFLYQIFSQETALDDWGMQAVVAQTGFGAALAIECIGRGLWQGAGVYSPEFFDPQPYLQLMEEAGFPYGIAERQDGQWHILRPCCLTPQTEAPSGCPA